MGRGLAAVFAALEAEETGAPVELSMLLKVKFDCDKHGTWWGTYTPQQTSPAPPPRSFIMFSWEFYQGN